jgi:hypothetical protein
MAELLARSFQERFSLSKATRGQWVLSDSSGLVLAVSPVRLGIHENVPRALQGGGGGVRRTGLPLAKLGMVMSIHHAMTAFFFARRNLVKR